jgi:hypothetical protein
MFPGVPPRGNNRDSGTLRVVAQRYERTIGAVAGDLCSVARDPECGGDSQDWLSRRGDTPHRGCPEVMQ